MADRVVDVSAEVLGGLSRIADCPACGTPMYISPIAFGKRSRVVRGG